MAVPAVFHALQHSALGTTITTSDWLFPTIETVHVFCLATVFGTIVMVDLRLLGLASRERPFSQLSRQLLPWTWSAFGLAAITGSLLFTSRAEDYMHLTPWYLKFFFMGLAGLNMAYFHFVVQRDVARWDTGAPSRGARLAGGASLVLWVLVIFCARNVGFLI